MAKARAVTARVSVAGSAALLKVGNGWLSTRSGDLGAASFACSGARRHRTDWGGNAPLDRTLSTFPAGDSANLQTCQSFPVRGEPGPENSVAGQASRNWTIPPLAPDGRAMLAQVPGTRIPGAGPPRTMVHAALPGLAGNNRASDAPCREIATARMSPRAAGTSPLQLDFTATISTTPGGPASSKVTLDPRATTVPARGIVPAAWMLVTPAVSTAAGTDRDPGRMEFVVIDSPRPIRRPELQSTVTARSTLSPAVAGTVMLADVDDPPHPVAASRRATAISAAPAPARRRAFGRGAALPELITSAMPARISHLAPIVGHDAAILVACVRLDHGPSLGSARDLQCDPPEEPWAGWEYAWP